MNNQSSLEESTQTELVRKKQKEKEDETIDTMKPRIKKLFMVIKKQLAHKDHPLNILAAKFVECYVAYYDK
jgi:hypothetical protein